MSQITINGKTYYGNNIVVRNGKVIIDGTDSTPESDKIINITVDGDLEKIECDSCTKIDIKGNVSKGVKTLSGDVEVQGMVDGDVSTQSGDVEYLGNSERRYFKLWYCGGLEYTP